MLNTLQTIKTIQHPCFDEDSHDKVGRVHLPVARVCNIHCNYCERNVCASNAMHHPGWTRKIVSVAEAVELVNSIVSTKPGHNFVIGVAGPGDALANEETFIAMEILHQQYPDILKCISTNGLLLKDQLPRIIEVGIRALTVTVNALDPVVGEKIYSRVKYDGIIYRGEKASALLIEKQFLGIKEALSAGLSLKVNTVFIPGVNDNSIVNLASHLKGIGVKLMNIMPLIPSGSMKNNPAPTCEELQKARRECEILIPQFRRCEQCRADLIYVP